MARAPNAQGQVRGRSTNAAAAPSMHGRRRVDQRSRRPSRRVRRGPRRLFPHAKCESKKFSQSLDHVGQSWLPAITSTDSAGSVAARSSCAAENRSAVPNPRYSGREPAWRRLDIAPYSTFFVGFRKFARLPLLESRRLRQFRASASCCQDRERTSTSRRVHRDTRRRSRGPTVRPARFRPARWRRPPRAPATPRSERSCCSALRSPTCCQFQIDKHEVEGGTPGAHGRGKAGRDEVLSGLIGARQPCHAHGRHGGRGRRHGEATHARREDHAANSSARNAPGATVAPKRHQDRNLREGQEAKTDHRAASWRSRGMPGSPIRCRHPHARLPIEEQGVVRADGDDEQHAHQVQNGELHSAQGEPGGHAEHRQRQRRQDLRNAQRRAQGNQQEDGQRQRCPPTTNESPRTGSRRTELSASCLRSSACACGDVRALQRRRHPRGCRWSALRRCAAAATRASDSSDAGSAPRTLCAWRSPADPAA